MKLKNVTRCVIASLLFAIMANTRVYAQADALVDMLQKKGLLTQREANDVKEQMFTEIRDQMPGTKIRVGSWLDELKIYGDMRLRYEQFWDRNVVGASVLGTNDEQDRTRYRYRLRLGMEAKAGEWTAGVRLASGDTGGPASDAISTNTTFDNWGGKKPINVDLAYITWEPGFINGLLLAGGKMENPFWESDMVFDSDLTPEGFAQKYKYSFNDAYSVFANLSQWALFEQNVTAGLTGVANNSIQGKDGYMFGYQVGHQWGIVPKKIELKQALAYYDYVGLRNQALATDLFTGAAARNTTALHFGQTVIQDQMQILAFNNEIKLGYLAKYPIRLQGEYIHNLGNTLAGGDSYLNEGYKVGAILGDAKKGQWQVGYWYEHLGANANLSFFSDSDFGNGGTNNKGHILKTAYNLTDWITLGLSYYNVTAIKNILGTGTPGGTLVNQDAANTQRVQVDAVMKF